MNREKWLLVCSLLLFEFGLFGFLIAMAYFDNGLLLLSLVILMSGTVGWYILSNPQKFPLYLKRRKD